jgi:nucleoside-diphosphate-sugar epimerase
MNIVIIGGGGMIGQKLARALAARGRLCGKEIGRVTLADMVEPADVPGLDAAKVTGNIADPADVARMIPEGTDVIYHLAAVVSGQAEADLDIGLAANLDGTVNILQRARQLGTCPLLVHTSSVAVYGGEVPDPILDHYALNPSTSYGAQKAMGEYLITDFSRRGLIDGRAYRLPTISVRPGKPNKAASSFMSSIIREPLNGQEAVCPVDEDFLHYYLSPRMVVENLIRGTEAPAEAFGSQRAMLMPGRTWSIRQLIDAMTEVAGPEPAKLIRWEPQPEIQAIVKGWRYDFRPEKALKLGLAADDSFADNVRYYLEDDRPGN